MPRFIPSALTRESTYYRNSIRLPGFLRHVLSGMAPGSMSISPWRSKWTIIRHLFLSAFHGMKQPPGRFSLCAYKKVGNPSRPPAGACKTSMYCSIPVQPEGLHLLPPSVYYSKYKKPPAAGKGNITMEPDNSWS